jgi:hypothetical protein
MREDIRLWREDARYDLDCAHDMLEHERFNYVVWLARQAIGVIRSGVCRGSVPQGRGVISEALRSGIRIKPNDGSS